MNACMYVCMYVCIYIYIYIYIYIFKGLDSPGQRGAPEVSRPGAILGVEPLASRFRELSIRDLAMCLHLLGGTRKLSRHLFKFSNVANN